MASVSVGTDTYGRVKQVSGTPIVTRFAMLQFLPVYPIESYYSISSGSTKTKGIPFVVSTESREFEAVPLARLEWKSVLMAYARGLFAVFVLIGFIGVISTGVSMFSGQPMDDIAQRASFWLAVALGIGVVGGGATYFVPLVPKREYQIRSYCKELLGIAMDPAKVSVQSAQQVRHHARQLGEALESPYQELIRDLVQTRAEIALGESAVRNESATDELLEQLRNRINDV